MSMTTWIILGIAVFEAAIIGALIYILIRQRRETRALDPVDVMRFVIPQTRAEAEDRRARMNNSAFFRQGCEVIDDLIQYEDDQRAEYYRGAWA